MLGALAIGTTRIGARFEGEDILRIADAMQAMGATVERSDDGVWSVTASASAGWWNWKTSSIWAMREPARG